MGRILIIDDDRSMRIILEKILHSGGHETVSAENGREGIRLYRENPVDLILTDLIMPDRDGLEVVREISAEFPDAKIFAMTSYDSTGSKGYLELAVEYGALRTFQKPFNRDDLLAAIDEALDNQI